MTLQQLKYYCTVCECGSITKAAQKVYVTQPAVTAAIRELEKEYAVRLVNKDGKRIRLTGAGEGFYQYASQMLENAQKFDQQVREMVNQNKKIRIGITKSAGSSVYTEYFSKHAGEYQDVELTLTVNASSILLEKLREQELDVLLLLNHGIDPMDDLETAELKKTEMLYCMSKEHALASEPSLTVPMIADEPMISTKQDDHKQKALIRLFQTMGCQKEPRITLRFEQLDTALKMVEANLGTGYFPAESVRQYAGIVGKPLEGDLSIPIYVVWSKESGRQEEVWRFISGIRQFYKAV